MPTQAQPLPRLDVFETRMDFEFVLSPTAYPGKWPKGDRGGCVPQFDAGAIRDVPGSRAGSGVTLRPAQ